MLNRILDTRYQILYYLFLFHIISQDHKTGPEVYNNIHKETITENTANMSLVIANPGASTSSQEQLPQRDIVLR